MRRARPVRTAFVLFFLTGVGLMGFFLFFRARDRRDPGVSSLVPQGTPLPGGEELELAIFSPHGQRLWRLRCKAATLTNAERLEAQEIRGEYYVTSPPTAFTAEKLCYDPDRVSLSLSRVVVTGPGLKLTGRELSWEEKSRSFFVEGGYSLSKDGVIMEGERLQIQKDFAALRAVGPVRLSLPLERSGVK